MLLQVPTQPQVTSLMLVPSSLAVMHHIHVTRSCCNSCSTWSGGHRQTVLQPNSYYAGGHGMARLGHQALGRLAGWLTDCSRCQHTVQS
jgi:hypothetical protein